MSIVGGTGGGSDFFALLRVLDDPDAYKAKLEELTARETEVAAKLETLGGAEEAKRIINAADNDRAEAKAHLDQAKQEAERIVAHARSSMAQERKQHTERMAEERDKLTGQKNDSARLHAELKSREDAISANETVVETKLNEIAAREKRLSERETKVKAKEDLFDKLGIHLPGVA